MVATAIVAGVTAAASAAGAIAKSIQARRNANRQQAELDQMKAENDAWYTRRYNEDYMERADNRRALEKARQTLIRQNQSAAGTQAIMGGTNASVAATKEANSQAYADAVSQVAVNASAAKDKVEDRYMQQKSNLHGKQMEVDNARAEANAAAIDAGVAGVQAAGQAFLAGHGIASNSPSATTVETIKPPKASMAGTNGVDANGNPVQTAEKLGGNFEAKVTKPIRSWADLLN